MKQLIVISLVPFCLFSCVQTVINDNESKNDSEFEPETISNLKYDLTYDSLDLNTIKGDFNGDGVEDNLIEKLVSSIDNKSINRLPQVEYDSLVLLINEKQPIVSLLSENKKIPELIVTKNTSFGLLWIKNEGDLNQDGADEISIIIDWADFSAINHCLIYSLKNEKWTELAKFEIREWQLNSRDGITPFNGFVKQKKNGKFEVLTFDSEMNEILKPLEKCW